MMPTDEFDKEMDQMAQLIMRAINRIECWIFIGFDADGQPCTLSNIEGTENLHRILGAMSHGQDHVVCATEIDKTKDN